MEADTLPQAHQGKYHCAHNGESNHWTVGNLFHALMPMPEKLSWAFESKSSGNRAPKKELNYTAGLISKATSKMSGLKSMALSGYITSPVTHQPPVKSNDTMDC